MKNRNPYVLWFAVWAAARMINDFYTVLTWAEIQGFKVLWQREK